MKEQCFTDEATTIFTRNKQQASFIKRSIHAVLHGLCEGASHLRSLAAKAAT
jgi:hypothetical protein